MRLGIPFTLMDGRPNRRNKAAFSFFFPVECGRAYVSESIAVLQEHLWTNKLTLKSSIVI